MSAVFAKATNVRVCGLRTAGATYITSDRDYFDDEMPFSKYIHCPPIYIDPSQIGLADQGMLMAIRPGTENDPVWDVFDIVGGDYHPVDWLIESATIGISRKITPAVAINSWKLDPARSRYWIVSRKGLIKNFEGIQKERLFLQNCPHSLEHHDDPEHDAYNLEMCVGMYWEDAGKRPDGAKRENEFMFPRNLDTQLGDYYAKEKLAYWPDGHTSEYEAAIIASFPIETFLFEIINDPDSDKALKAFEQLEKAGSQIPYMIVEE